MAQAEAEADAAELRQAEAAEGQGRPGAAQGGVAARLISPAAMPNVQPMPRCFACHTSLPRAALHLQNIPAGYRGRRGNATVLMCAQCHEVQGAANKTANKAYAVFAVVFLIICTMIGLLRLSG